MTTTEIVHCLDDQFHQAVSSLGPYMGDYPEQTALACMVQNWCPKYVMDFSDIFVYNVHNLYLGAQHQQMTLTVRDAHLTPKNMWNSS